MSGQTLYRLRQNKAVDRFTFIELLRRISLYDPINVDKYRYVGFGGPSLEDFKLLHSVFGIEDMLSLEHDEQPHKRQRFNKPVSCIQCLHKASKAFVDEFIRERETIIWLDYEAGRELPNQLEEVETLIEKFDFHDILRVTLNAEPKVWKEGDRKHPERLAALSEALAGMFPRAKAERKHMSQKKFPEFLVFCLEHIAGRALQSRSDVVFVPLTLFTYADGQQMMTMTGILLGRDEKGSFLEKTHLGDWHLATTSWGSPKPIDIAEMTLRERLAIDKLLPEASIDEIHTELDFYFGRSEVTSRKVLEMYTQFYRYAPFFSEVVT